VVALSDIVSFAFREAELHSSPLRNHFCDVASWLPFFISAVQNTIDSNEDTLTTLKAVDAGRLDKIARARGRFPAARKRRWRPAMLGMRA
jgi:hypothetical protein